MTDTMRELITNLSLEELGEVQALARWETYKRKRKELEVLRKEVKTLMRHYYELTGNTFIPADYFPENWIEGEDGIKEYSIPAFIEAFFDYGEVVV